MPRLWTETMEAHRHQVRDAILDTTAALVAEQGLLAVTMSEIAERTGIGRATLYKYFPDVQAILLAWHERQVAHHLHHLTAVRDQAGTPGERLEAVLGAYAQLQHGLMRHHRQERHGADLAALLHRHDHVGQAQRHVHRLLRELLAEAAASGDVRDDVAPDELAGYCLHALTAAGGLPSAASVRRLVAVTLAGLRPAD